MIEMFYIFAGCAAAPAASAANQQITMADYGACLAQLHISSQGSGDEDDCT
jgi:hypothetical protein